MDNPSLSDRQHVSEQYGDASNLDARITLHDRFSMNRYGWFRWVWDHLHLPAVAHVLELGSGTGRLWRENADRIPAGWHVTVSDGSAGMLQEAQTTLQNVQHPLTFLLVDAQSIPLPDESFDAVIANHMLYHVPERQRAYAEIRRVLKQGGRLYASTVGGAHLREIDELIGSVSPDVGGLTGLGELGFSLENGAGELSAWFSDVVLHRYEDALSITEVDPLVAYILSTGVGKRFTAKQIYQIRQTIEQQLASKREFRVTKESGLFEARKPAGG